MLLIHENSSIPISVIITNHKYEEYLEEAIISVITQSAQPAEIIVIDDEPENEIAERIVNKYKPYVKYHKVNFKDPLKSREYGFKISSSKYVCFLDADDYLDKSYLQGATQTLIENPKTEIVYSDIQYFKDAGIGRINLTRTNFSKSIPHKRISQTNFLHVGCVVSKKVIIASNAFNHNATWEKYHEDWMFWRKIIETTNCEYTKQPNFYYARKHGKNRSNTLEKEANYPTLRGVDLSTITFVGRTDTEIIDDPWFVTEFFNGICNCKKFRNRAILFGDYITEEEFKITAEISKFKQTNKLDILNKVARTATSDYVFFYNENEPPIVGTVQTLLGSLDHDVAVVQRKNREILDSTLIVTSILRDYFYYDLENLPFDPINEKFIYK